MPVTVLLPDDGPAFTGLSDVSLSVHITNTNVFAPDATFARPRIQPNFVLAASTGVRAVTDFKKAEYPQAPRVTSAEFELLASKLGANQIVIEFETGDIPSEPWRYQIYSRATGASHAHVIAVSIFSETRLAVATIEGSLRKNVGYRLFVLIPSRLLADGSISNATTVEEMQVLETGGDSPLGADMVPYTPNNPEEADSLNIINFPTSSKVAKYLDTSMYPSVVKAGDELWASHNENNLAARTGLIYERPFFVNSKDRLFDDNVEMPRQYGSKHKTSGRNPDHGSKFAREDLVTKYRDNASKTRFRNVAGAREETAAEVLARGGDRPRLLDINKPDPEEEVYFLVGASGGDVEFPAYKSFQAAFISGVEIIVEEAVELDVCGGESLNKILPALLRAFGSNLAELRGEPVTRTLNQITASAQEKVPKGYLLGKIRVETTLAFPKDLQFGPYKVWINGFEFEYSHATSGCNAYLVDVVSKDYLQDSIPANAQVVLDVPSLPPEIIGLG